MRATVRRVRVKRAVRRQSRRKIRRRAAGSLHERGAVATAAAMSAMHSTPMLNQLTKNLLEKYRLKTRPLYSIYRLDINSRLCMELVYCIVLRHGAVLGIMLHQHL